MLLLRIALAPIYGNAESGKRNFDQSTFRSIGVTAHAVRRIDRTLLFGRCSAARKDLVHLGLKRVAFHEHNVISLAASEKLVLAQGGLLGIIACSPPSAGEPYAQFVGSGCTRGFNVPV